MVYNFNLEITKSSMNKMWLILKQIILKCFNSILVLMQIIKAMPTRVKFIKDSEKFYWLSFFSGFTSVLD